MAEQHGITEPGRYRTAVRRLALRLVAKQDFAARECAGVVRRGIATRTKHHHKLHWKEHFAANVLMQRVESARFVSKQQWRRSRLSRSGAAAAELRPGRRVLLFALEKALPAVGDFCNVRIDPLPDRIVQGITAFRIEPRNEERRGMH